MLKFLQDQSKVDRLVQIILDDLVGGSILLLKALSVLVVGYYLAKFFRRKSKKILLLMVQDEMLSSFLSKAVFIGLLIVSVIAALGTLGVQTTSIIAALGAAGLAIALALKDSLSNLASGIMIIILRPFNIGDEVCIGSNSGIIESISLFETKLRTGDNRLIIFPNRNVNNREIINISIKPTKRLEWSFSVPQSINSTNIKDLIKESIKDMENVEQERTFIGLTNIKDKENEITIRLYLTNNATFATKNVLVEKVRLILDTELREVL